MKSRYTISVISHGHGGLLRTLLRDILALPSASLADVVVTLNLPGEQFDADEFQGLRLSVVRNASPQGFGRNHNNAFKHCATEWFFVINPDLRISQDAFADTLRAALHYPGAALLAPAVINPAGAVEDSVRENLTISSLWARHKAKRAAEPTPTPAASSSDIPFRWFAGMFLCLRASAYRAVGGFDERFFLYCEDYDLSARLYLAGYGLAHVPEVAVVHDARRDSHRSFRHLRWHLASLMRVWLSGAFWRIWWKH